LWHIGRGVDDGNLIATFPSGGSDSLVRAMSFDGQILVFADGNGGFYRSDGTAEGSVLVKETEGYAMSSAVVPFQDRFYFVTGDDLWVTDGTKSGTTLVKEFVADGPIAGVSSLVAVGDRLFMAANDGVHGSELWTSDGTAGGTLLAADINAGAQGSVPTELTRSGDRLYFSANDGQHGRELWSVDLAMQALVGDVDGNDVVDALDFAILRNNFGMQTDQGVAVGDLDEDGEVSFADFLLLSHHLEKRSLT